MSGAMGTLTMLLERGADAEATDARRGPRSDKRAAAAPSGVSLTRCGALRSDNTPLHCAALARAPAAGRALLAAGAGAAPRDEDEDTPAHEAARWGRVGLLSALLAAGAPADAANCAGWTPLHCAAAYGRHGAAAALLRAGADATRTTQDGRTAAQLAKSDAVRALLAA
jgi:ankyrin repeat protein